jgi:hypothetical protein
MHPIYRQNTVSNHHFPRPPGNTRPWTSPNPYPVCNVAKQVIFATSSKRNQSHHDRQRTTEPLAAGLRELMRSYSRHSAMICMGACLSTRKKENWSLSSNGRPIFSHGMSSYVIIRTGPCSTAAKMITEYPSISSLTQCTSEHTHSTTKANTFLE